MTTCFQRSQPTRMGLGAVYSEPPQWKPGDTLTVAIEIKEIRKWDGVLECYIMFSDDSEMYARASVEIA